MSRKEEISDVVMALITRFLVYLVLGLFIGYFFFSPSDAKASEKALVTSVVKEKAMAHKVDPQLVLAVIEVESMFNRNKTGPRGEIGLMQLLPAYFPNAKHDIMGNIELGISYMAFVKNNCPVKRDFLWISCYNSGIHRRPKHPELLPYYKRIMSVYKRNKIQAEGRQAKFN